MNPDYWRIAAVLAGVALMFFGARVGGRIADLSRAAYWHSVLSGGFVAFVVACIILNVFAGREPTPGVKLFAVVTPVFVIAFVIVARVTRIRR